MKSWRVWAGAAVIAALTVVIGVLGVAPSLARAEIPQQVPSSSLPPPHLGYGMNVRSQDKVDLFAPLGFDWLKLWEEYGTEQNPTLPQIRYPYRVLFLIDCTERSDDLDVWGEAVETIAIAGKGLVEAYEICNEPNRQGWLDRDVSPAPPDPGLYVQMLQVAYERIKAVDPGAIVVSAGLAPVGRIEGTCNGWSGNNCGAMDEREYARQMFLLGAGETFDAFGYHPYGFAYAPETDPHSVSNGFAFRGVEVMHDLLVQHGLGDKPVWATEFSWLRDPNEDGEIPGWCHYHPPYEDNFGWMDVPEVQQASYITRAFQYADEHWPWMGAMFVWNLDWHDYNDTWVCEPARYFSVLKIDYTDYRPFMAPGGPGDGFWRLGAVDGEDCSPFLDAQPAPYTTTLAYDALAAMEKRLVNFEPRLAVVPPTIVFLGDVDEPGVLRDVVVPLNTGFGVFTWTATVAVGLQVTGTGTVGLQVTPTLAITTGLQGTLLTVTVDSTGYSTGTFTGIISVTATTTGVLDAPQAVPVTLHVVPELRRLYLPVTLRSTR